MRSDEGARSHNGQRQAHVAIALTIVAKIAVIVSRVKMRVCVSREKGSEDL